MMQLAAKESLEQHHGLWDQQQAQKDHRSTGPSAPSSHTSKACVNDAQDSVLLIHIKTKKSGTDEH